MIYDDEDYDLCELYSRFMGASTDEEIVHFLKRLRDEADRLLKEVHGVKE